MLKRVVAVVKFLSEHGIAFRGDSNTFGSPGDGNYSWCLELICQFDPFLRESIAHFWECTKEEGHSHTFPQQSVTFVFSLGGGR